MFEKQIAYIVVHYRWVFVILFLLPISFFYDIFWTLRVKYQEFTRKSAPQKHKERVAAVCGQINKWREDGCKNFMCTARPGWLTVSIRVGKYKDTLTKVDVHMHDILHIDTEKRIIRAEPGVTMGQITKVLTPLGWTLAVVPELDDLTVGGVINGFGVETSSFRHGLFQHTVSAFEIVLPNGKCVTATETEYPDLFRTIPWSHGTLGFLVSADIKIVPAASYVKVDYIPVHDKKQFCALMEKHARRTDDGIDFVEGLQYTIDNGVVMVAKMVDQVPKNETHKINAIGKCYKEWFYKHVENFLGSTKPDYEYIPLRDYFHRHTKSFFWELSDVIPFGNHPLFRYTLGWLVPPKISLLKITTVGELRKLYTQRHVVQDMLVPIRDLEASIDLFDEEFNIYPLWHCPMKIPSANINNPIHDKLGEGLVKPLENGDDMFIDIGAYGNPKPVSKKWEVVSSLRKVEEFVRQVKGFQALYADTYMSREEFRKMFNHELYDQVRIKYDSIKAFPEIYDKVSMSARR